MTENNLIYLCVSDKEFGRRVPYAFLDQVTTNFLKLCNSNTLVMLRLIVAQAVTSVGPDFPILITYGVNVHFC